MNMWTIVFQMLDMKGHGANSANINWECVVNLSFVVLIALAILSVLRLSTFVVGII